MGLNKNPTPGVGQACSKFQHDGGLPNSIYLLGISEPTITSLSDPGGDHAFARALHYKTNSLIISRIIRLELVVDYQPDYQLNYQPDYQPGSIEVPAW